MIRGLEGLSYEKRLDEQAFAASATKTGTTRIHFVIREGKTLKRENNIYVKTQY